MLTSEARIETDRPSRYLVQICKHMSNRGRHLGNLLSHRSGAGHARPDGPIDVDWSETDGLISMAWGRCVLRADEGTLILRAEAAEAGNLARIQDLLRSHVARFSRRAPLAVIWQPTQ